MGRVTIDGRSYATPYANLFPPHPDDELNTLRESVKANGILVPVHVCVTPGRGRVVIDGATRTAIANELGQDVPSIDHGELTDDQAECLAVVLNAVRRHLGAIAYAAAIIRLRKTGMTQSAIAQKTGLSQPTVSRLLASQLIHDELTDEEPEPLPPVTGKDGKSYPARRQKLVCEQSDDELADIELAALAAKANKALATLVNLLQEMADGPRRQAFHSALHANGVEWSEGCGWDLVAGIRGALEVLQA